MSDNLQTIDVLLKDRPYYGVSSNNLRYLHEKESGYTPCLLKNSHIKAWYKQTANDRHILYVNDDLGSFREYNNLSGVELHEAVDIRVSQLRLSDLAVKHDYYAHDSNYYSNEATEIFDTWQDFLVAWGGDLDIDYNLIYRWDIYAPNEDNPNYHAQFTFILQRKGIYKPVIINSLQDSDTDSIVAYLNPHFDKLLNLWQPLALGL